MRILYLSPHQDDEVLTMGASIRQDVAAGHDVWVYLVCQGDKSTARTRPELVNRLGYVPTVRAFCEARDREFAASVPNLGAKIKLIPLEQREPEQETIPERIADTVQATFSQGFDLLCAHTFTDPHRDHANTGRAAKILVDRGFASSWRTHVAFYNLSYHKTPPDPPIKVRGHDFPVTLAEQEPYRRVDLPNGFWGVGYISVSSLFVGQLTDPFAYYFDQPPPKRVLRLTSGDVLRDANGEIRYLYRTFEQPSDTDLGVV